MKDGALDGLMVNIDGAYDLKIPETATYALISKELWMGRVYLLVMNKKTWESLAPKDQKAINRAAEKAYRTLGDVMDKSFDRQIAHIRASGATVRLLEKNEIEKWQTATNYQQVQDKWVQTQEQSGIKNMSEVLQKVRKMLDSKK